MEKNIQTSTMFRALSGEIQAWDPNSEAAYGFKHSHAIGNTSHRLLKTIFPEPLQTINKRLMTEKKWRGELIHTRADGEQVKVLSEWEVVEDLGGPTVVREINALFTPLEPETAQLKEADLQKVLTKYDLKLRKKAILLKELLSINLVFVVIFLAMIAITWGFFHESALHPLP